MQASLLDPIPSFQMALIADALVVLRMYRGNNDWCLRRKLHLHYR